MDKTIEIILVAMVVMLTALVVVYMVQGEADSFGEFLDDQQTDANCGLAKSKFERKCACETSDPPTSESYDYKQQYIDQCEWAQGGGNGYTCNDFC